MKVVIITGSAHKNGTSAYLTEKFIEGAKETGNEVYRFDAGFKMVHPCTGCDRCRTGGAGCVYKDDMEELNPHLLEADAVVFVSPIYYYNINAQIKAVIDRFYANDEKLHKGKKTAMILTMADDTLESADGPIAFFRGMTKFLEWEIAGIVAATNCWTLDMLKKTNFPQQAYELGKAM